MRVDKGETIGITLTFTLSLIKIKCCALFKLVFAPLVKVEPVVCSVPEKYASLVEGKLYIK